MLFPRPRSITIAIMTLVCYSDHSTEKYVLPGNSKNHVFTMWENLPLNESVFENKMHCRKFESLQKLPSGLYQWCRLSLYN